MADRFTWGGRVAAVFVALSVVGILLGAALEDIVYRDTPTPLERVEAKADRELAPPDDGRRSAQEEAILARALVHFPPYPHASARPEALASDYLGQDSPIAVAWFPTQDTPQQVLEHYRQVLREAGLPVVGHIFGPNGGYVGYWSPKTQEVRLVSVIAQGGETMVFVSAGQVEKAIENRPRVPDWIPLPDRTGDTPGILTLQLEGMTQFVVSGTVESDNMVEVEAGWREQLRSKGWQAGVGSVTGFQTRSFEVDHDGLKGQALLRQASPGAAVEFNLSLMRRM